MKLKMCNPILLFLCLSLALGCGKDSSGEDGEKTEGEEKTPEVEPKEKLTTNANKTFVHPGLLHTSEDFDRIKAKVEANEEPWVSGWDKLITNSHSASTYTPNPVEKLVRGGNSREEPDPDNYGAAFNDAAAAYQTAIRWKITGDEAYAQASIKILNAWASTCKSISGNSNIALAAGLYGYQFATAAEIMRDYGGWAQEDFNFFKQWLLDVFYPVSHAFITTHWNTCISHYWANWDLANLANIMAIGVLTDNAELYNEAITYLMEGKGNGNLDLAIYHIHGDGTGQLQESGRDQGHALLCIGLLGTIAEMAWNQGDDLYGYDDNRILKGAEYAAKYNFANLNVAFEPYNNCDGVNHTVVSEVGKGNKRPIWEMIHNHYVKRKGLNAPYVELAVGVHRPEGGGGDYGPNSGGFDSLGFGTLLFYRE
jgi:hypothetical protein